MNTNAATCSPAELRLLLDARWSAFAAPTMGSPNCAAFAARFEKDRVWGVHNALDLIRLRSKQNDEGTRT